jgi:predicted Holliday junction resolvase-like endonuclease
MLALVIVLGLLLAAGVVFVVVRERQYAAYRERYTATRADVDAARSHSVATSKGSTLGQAAEHLAPLFPEMVAQFTPGDWRFLASPVDFVVFDGLSGGTVRRIVFVEVKTGEPRLNARQAQIRSAIANDALAVEWMTLRTPTPSSAGRRRVRPRIIELPPD